MKMSVDCVTHWETVDRFRQSPQLSVYRTIRSSLSVVWNLSKLICQRSRLGIVADCSNSALVAYDWLKSRSVFESSFLLRSDLFDTCDHGYPQQRRAFIDFEFQLSPVLSHSRPCDDTDVCPIFSAAIPNFYRAGPVDERSRSVKPTA